MILLVLVIRWRRHHSANIACVAGASERISGCVAPSLPVRAGAVAWGGERAGWLGGELNAAAVLTIALLWSRLSQVS